ncbi:MAG: hypothetical protein NTX24_03385 [Candidatus Pacearchaeota archaeon]|nr:hypothetical protein [Candidatus Pacearchaeota archaeon]
MLEKLIKTLVVAAGITLASLGLVGKANASPIVAYVHPPKLGAQVTLIPDDNSDTVKVEVGLGNFFWWDTELFNPKLKKGQRIYIAIDSGAIHFETSYLIDTIGLEGSNFPQDGYLSPKTNKMSLSVREMLGTPLGVPDTPGWAYFWMGKQPSKRESVQVGKWYQDSTYHKVFVGIEPDSLIEDGDWFHYLVKFVKGDTPDDTTFQRLDSFEYNKEFDGNARLVDTVHLDTILPGAVKEYPEYEIPIGNRTKSLQSIVSSQQYIQDLVRQGNELYDLSGRRVDGDVAKGKKLKKGIYFLKGKDEEESARRFLLIR